MERIKQRARYQTKQAIKKGILKRPETCVCCGRSGSGRIVAHHPDYSKPLEVQWLCDTCHAPLARPARRYKTNTRLTDDNWIYYFWEKDGEGLINHLLRQYYSELLEKCQGSVVDAQRAVINSYYKPETFYVEHSGHHPSKAQKKL